MRFKEGDVVDLYFADGERQNGVRIINAPTEGDELWYFELDNGVQFAQNPRSSLFDQMIKHKEQK